MTLVTPPIVTTVTGHPSVEHPLGTSAEYEPGLVESLLGVPERRGFKPPAISPPRERPAWVQLAEELGEPFPDRLFASALKHYGNRVTASAARINEAWRLGLETQDREALELALFDEELLLAFINQPAHGGPT